MSHRTVARLGLAYLSAIALALGIWAGGAPRSFYENFPGLGMTWVSVDGPYNEHLVRDVDVFRLPHLGSYTFVGDRFVERVRASGLVGLDFEPRWSAEGGPVWYR